MSNLNASLSALSEQQAAEVSALTDRACDAIRVAYKAVSGSDGTDRYDNLRAALVGAVEGARRAARDAAAAHVLGELRLVVPGRGLPPLDMAREPERADVSEYIDNAVQAARDAADAEQSIESTAWHADRVIESEAFRTYNAARLVAEQSLAAMPAEDAERFGFRVAGELDRSAGETQTRSEGLIPLLGKMWDAVNDRRTCEVCSRLHGGLGVLGRAFDEPGPPAHARCRCVSHLWAVGWVKRDEETENAMDQHQQRGGVARYDTTIQTREVDESGRVVRGAVASDESIDSHGSIIKAKGWDLQRFNRNPILLWQHKSGGFAGAEPEDVLGTASLYVKGKKLLADLKFSPPGANPKADMVWGQVQRKEVRGLSVGFRPRKYHFEKRGEGSDDELMIIDEAELVELSVVMIPSNANTLIEQVRSMNTNERPAVAGQSETANEGRDNNPSASVPTTKEDETMSDPKVSQIPAGLAAALSTDNLDEAIRKVQEMHLRLEQADKKAEDLRAERDQAVAELDAHRNQVADSEVDALVKLGLIKEESREIAQNFARTDLPGFQAMYADQRAALAKRDAPKAGLLKPVVSQTAKPAGRPAAKAEKFARDHKAEVRRLMKDEGLQYAEANERAYVNLTQKGGAQ